MFGYSPQLPPVNNSSSSISSLQYPTFGQYSSLSQLYQTTLGPSGIPGVDPQGGNVTVAGGFGGVLGGDMGGFTSSSVPQYQTVVNQQPVYQPFSDQIDPCAGLIGMPCQGNPGQYNTNWQQIVKADDPNNTGTISGAALNNLDYINPANGQATPLSQYGVTSISDTGLVQGQQLMGYQPVVSEQLTGYFDMTAYASTQGSNIGMTFVPASAGQSIQQAYAGYGSMGLSPTAGYGYPTDPGVAFNGVSAPTSNGGLTVPYAVSAASPTYGTSTASTGNYPSGGRSGSSMGWNSSWPTNA